MLEKILIYLTDKKVFHKTVVAEPIQKGASGASIFVIYDNNRKYILKISKESNSIDPNRLAAFKKEYDFYCLNKNLDLPFTPKAFYCEEHSEYGYILVIEYFNQIPYKDWDIEMQKKAINICAKMNSLSVTLFKDLNLNCDMIEIDKKATEVSYNLWLNVIRQHDGKFDESILSDIYEHLDVVCPILNSKPLRICHGDFHPDNILTDGNELYIVDWQNLHLGKSTGDISFFLSRGSGFGITLDRDELFTYYAERLSEYTKEKISCSQLLCEDSASTLLTTFMFWAYHLKDVPYDRVELFYNKMIESYHYINSMALFNTNNLSPFIC